MRLNAIALRQLQHLQYAAIALMIAGMGCFAPALGLVETETVPMTWLWLAAGALLAGGAVAVASAWITSNDMRKLARKLRKEAGCEWMEPIDVHSTSLPRL